MNPTASVEPVPVMPATPLPQDDLAGIASRTADLAPALADAKVLVVGANGFIGTWMVEALDAFAHHAGIRLDIVAGVRDAARFARSHPHLRGRSKIMVAVGDLADREPWPGLTGVTHVLHAGSMVNLRGTPAQALAVCDTIAVGTRRLLERATGWPLRRLLLVSSGGVYGPCPAGVEAMPEGSPVAPNGLGPAAAYGVSKRAAEVMASLHGEVHGYTAVIARVWTLIGPRMPLDGGFAAGNFLADALAGRPVRITGDGATVRSYQYAADAAVWLLTLLVRGRPGIPYHVGSSEPVSIRDLAAAIDRLAGGHGVEVLPRGPGNGIVDRYLPAIGAAAEGLGLANHVSLDDAVRRTAAWFRPCI